MTRKDYNAIAKAIADVMNHKEFSADTQHNMLIKQGIQTAMVAVATVLHQDNPNFDAKRFYKACGM